MRRPLPLVLLLALLTSLPIARTHAAEAPDLSFVSEETVTPHVPWARPFALGPTRVIALIAGGYQMRELVELKQRFEFDIQSSIFIGGPSLSVTWAIGSTQLSNDLMAEHYNALLAPNAACDVVLMSGQAWDFLTPASRKRLADMVRSGTGLVWIDPRPSSPDAWELLPVTIHKGQSRMPLASVEPHDLLQGVPLTMMPEISVRQYALKEDLAFERELLGGDAPSLLISGSLGKGRVMIIGWEAYDRGTSAYTSALLPIRASVQNDLPRWPWWEHAYSIVGRAVLWAARKEPPVSLERLRATPEEVSTTLGGAAPPAASAELLVHDAWGRQVHRQPDIAPSAGRLRAPLPPLPRGRYSASIILRSDGASLAFATAALDVAASAPGQIRSLTLARDHWDRSETLTGQLELATPGGTDLRLELRDGYQRLVAATVVPAAHGVQDIAMPLHRVKGTWAALDVTLLDGDRPIDRTRQEIIIAADRTWDDFRIMVWASGPDAHTEHLHDARYRQFVRMGIDMLVNQDRQPWYLWGILHNNLQMCTRISGWGKGYLHTPAQTDAIRPQLEADAALWAKFGPLLSQAGDESFADPYDEKRASLRPDVRDAFAEWLREQYGSLDALNRQWQSNFTDWSQVEPRKLIALQATTGNFSCFSDLKTFTEFAFAYRYQAIQESMTAGDPGSRNSASGTQSAYTYYKSYDWWRMMTGGGFKALQGYTHGDQVEQQFSFADIPQMFWNGYGAQGDRLVAQILQSLWRGGDGVGLFAGRLFLEPDFSWNDGSRGLAKVAPIVKGGLGMLLRHAQFVFDRVAIHYSQRSIHAAAATHRASAMSDAVITGGRTLMHSFGLESKYLSYAQLEDGALDPQAFPLFYMPHSLALSEKEAEAIRSYVAQGGIVLADLMPGIMDGHARTLERGLLDDVFGITRKLPTAPPPINDELRERLEADARRAEDQAMAAAAPDSPEANIIDSTPLLGDLEELTADKGPQFHVGLPATVFPPQLVAFHATDGRFARIEPTGETTDALPGFAFPQGATVTTVDPTVQPAGATVLARETTTGAPLLLVHRHGRGTAILLNCDLLEQAGQRVAREDPAQRLARHIAAMPLLAPLLEAARLTPRALIVGPGGEPIPMHDVQMFELGSDLYLRPLVPDHVTEPPTLVLSRKAHVYEMSQGRYLGHLDRITLPVPLPGPDYALALLQRQVQGIDLQLPAQARAGSEVTLDIRIQSQGEPGFHAVAISATNPAGEHVEVYRDNIACPRNRGTMPLPLALDEMPGTWTFTARDAATGITATTTMQVTP